MFNASLLGVKLLYCLLFEVGGGLELANIYSSVSAKSCPAS